MGPAAVGGLEPLRTHRWIRPWIFATSGKKTYVILANNDLGLRVTPTDSVFLMS